jgi:uncharacterized protein (DUF58 family)
MLTRELLRKIRKIEIVTQRLVRDRMAGQYHSVFKGSGIAFSEVRQYMPGDDIRLIDWNVSARMNGPYVKLFVEEREMTVLLLVDMSASGRFGSANEEKRELAAELAAVLAFSAIKNSDRVGLIIFTDEVERFVPPKKGKKHVLRVISEILSFSPQSPRTNLAVGLDFWATSPTTSPWPFWCRISVAAGQLRTRPAHRLAQARSRAGGGFRPARRTTAQGGTHRPSRSRNRRDGGLRFVRSRGARLRRRKPAQRAAREALFRRLSLDAIAVSTDRPYLPALTSFFEARARRMRH